MRSSFAKLRRGVGFVLLLVGSWVIVSGPALRALFAAQAAPPPPAGIQLPPPFGQPPEPNDPMQRQQQERMEKARNVDRQKQLERDTDKLFELAKELKEEVNKSNKDTLSVNVVKKAAEIEKLAKSVKDRMRG